MRTHSSTRYNIWWIILVVWSLSILRIFKDVNFQQQADSEHNQIDFLSQVQWFIERITQPLVSLEDTETESIDNIFDSSVHTTWPTSLSQNTKGTDYNPMQTLSLNEIIDSVTSNITNQDEYDTLDDLQERYEESKDITLWTTLIQQLNSEYKFQAAYEILQTFDSMSIKQLDPHLVMRTLFNTKLVNQNNQNLVVIDNILNEFSAANLLNTKEVEWYKALFFLVRGDKTNFIKTLPSWDISSPLSTIVNDLRQKIEQSSQWHDIPAYYTDGMIALGLFQYGYPYIAQQLSLQLLLLYPDYILPKQILAYTYMILQDRSQAKSYFIQLMRSDPNNRSSYQLFAGIASYWMEDYKDAILYLNQINNEDMVSDVIRYKILSYINLEDWSHAARNFKALLAYSDIDASDIIFTREQFVFKPYILWEDFSLLQQDNTLLSLYTEKCKELDIDRYICSMGEIARTISSGQTLSNDDDIKTILFYFPRSYLYYILGEYYQNQGEIDDAQRKFISWMSLTRNPKIQTKFKEKLADIL